MSDGGGMYGVRYDIEPTEGRIERRGEFICVVRGKRGRLRPRSRLVVLVRQAGSLGVLLVIARQRVDPGVPQGVAQLDQTLRKSLGLGGGGRGHTVVIAPLRRVWRHVLGDLVARIVGSQYVHFRVYRALIADAEKPVCRINQDMFALLGCREGDIVLCENASFHQTRGWTLERVRLRALVGTAPLRSPDVGEAPVIGTEGDIRSLRIDAEARDLLSAAPWDSVRVRRDVRPRTADGIALFLSILGVAKVLSADGAALVVAYAAVAVAALSYVVWRIRAELP